MKSNGESCAASSTTHSSDSQTTSGALPSPPAGSPLVRRCRDVGFGNATHSSFMKFGGNKSGTINWHEILKGLKHGCFNEDGSGTFSAAEWTADLTRILREDDDGRMKAQPPELSLDATSEEALGDSLRAAFRARTASVADLIELLNYDSMAASSFDRHFYTLDEREFRRAMRERFRFSGSDEILHQAFSQIDTSASGRIDENELFIFMHGRPNYLGQMRSVESQLAGLKIVPSCGYEVGEPWTSEDLKR